MSDYQKQTWVNYDPATPLSAERLAHIEQGVDDLDGLRLDILTELERRDRAAQIPGEIERLTRQYVADGHDPGILTECVTEASAPPVVEVA